MSGESFSQLCKEIQKFSGLRISDEVHSAANNAISIFTKSKVQLPIENSASNIVKFIVVLFESRKFNQPQTFIFSKVIQAIQNRVFTGAALETILSCFTLVSNDLTNEQSMELVQLITENIPNFFPSIPNLNSVFTIVLTLISRKDVLISTTAYAFFPQIMDSLKKLIISRPTQEYINYCKEKYYSIFQKFEKPYYFIFYLLFSDLTNIAFKQKTFWLTKITDFPTQFIYDLLDLIVNQYSDIVQSEPQLICIFDGAVIQAMSDQNALPFIICFIDRFLESNASLCSAIFEDFLSHISPKNRQSYKSLFLFREIAARNQNLPLRIFLQCDKNKNDGNDLIYVKLIHSLSAFEVSLNRPTKPLAYSLKPSRLDSISTEKGILDYLQNSTYEIIFGILRSFVVSTDEGIGKWADLTYKSIIKMIISALRYSTLESLECSREAITNLLIIMHKRSKSNIFDKVFQSICNLSSYFSSGLNEEQQQIFQSFDKQGIYNQYLCRLAENHPEICSGRWLSILSSIFKSKTTLSLNFASRFDPNEVQSIVEVVIAITPLPYDFIATLVAANISRFDIIWNLLKPFFNFSIKEKKFDDNVLNLLLELMSRSIAEENEEAILTMASEFVSEQSSLNIANKGKILHQLRQLLAEKVNVIKKGWNQIFNILQPSNYDNNVETIQFSFSVLTLISNDYIQLVPESSLKPLIDVIFKFADDEADINVSLSSFDLLWGVVRVMENTSENWTYLVTEVLRLVKDTRNDVSQCAIRTFFSLMSSNFETIPNEVINRFVSSSFSQILNCIDFNDKERAGDFELALQEMSHYTSTFWTKFDENPDFKKTFLPLLIDKATSFCSKCENQELVTSAFQLYQNLFECSSLDYLSEDLLRNSLMVLTKEFVKINDPNSIVFPCFGRLIGVILTTLKKRNVIPTLPKWFPLIREIVTKMVSPIYVHITVQRALDSIPSLFPMRPENENIGYETVGLLVEFAIGSSNTAVCPFIINILIRVFENIKNSNKNNQNLNGSLNYQYLSRCKPLIMVKASEPLMKVILQAKVSYDQSSANEVFECFTSIKKIWPSLRHDADSALVMLIDKAGENAQKEFVKSNFQDFEIIELLWKNFLNPNSEKFNLEVSKNCTYLTLNAISYFIDSFAAKKPNIDENTILKVLNFLAQSRLPPNGNNKFPKNNQKWHLLMLMKSIVSIVDSPNEQIRKAAKEVLGQASEVVTALIY